MNWCFMDFPHEQEWDEELEFVLKCCVLKCQLCIELFLGGFLPVVLLLSVLWSAADSLSSPVAARSPRAAFPE